jgi:hypothetical protein
VSASLSHDVIFSSVASPPSAFRHRVATQPQYCPSSGEYALHGYTNA